jgi:RNA polymerase sigma factor (sigma-70 family)
VLYSALSDEELVQQCAASKDRESWEAFIGRFHTVIAGAAYRALRRKGLVSVGAVEDLTQETYAKLYDPKRNVLGRFEPRHPGSAKGFLRAVTMNLVSDYLKANRREDSVAHTEDGVGEGGHQPYMEVQGGVKSMDLDVLLGEVDAVLQESPTPAKQRDRQIFWFHYRDGMSPREIAELPWIGLSLKGVESALLRTAKLVRHKVKKPPDRSEKNRPISREDYSAAESL